MFDNKEQEIRLQKAAMKNQTDTILLVDSDAKAAKERSMETYAATRYEEELEAIKKELKGRGLRGAMPCNAALGNCNPNMPMPLKLMK